MYTDRFCEINSGLHNFNWNFYACEIKHNLYCHMSYALCLIPYVDWCDLLGLLAYYSFEAKVSFYWCNDIDGKETKMPKWSFVSLGLGLT